MMMTPARARRPVLAAAANQLLAALLVALHLPAGAARPGERDLVDFAKLAQNRPRPCGPAAASVAGPTGWKEAPPLCAWHGRLQMRRWQSGPASAAAACVAAPAAWLAWQRPRAGVPTAAHGAAWQTGWSSHYLAGPAPDGMARIAMVERRAAGDWVATEWTWSPSPRAATRAWQRGRWELLAAAASVARGADATPPGPLRNAWEGNLQGRAAQDGPDGWRWSSAGVCLRMVALPASGAPLPLPYAREDARLEQRAAMQIQLARRYPGATFLMPIRLLDAPAAAPRAGAAYAAIWTDRAQVTGQLWLPRKDDGPPLRAQVSAGLPARYDTPSGLAAGTRAWRAIERELNGIAAAWSADHER